MGQWLSLLEFDGTVPWSMRWQLGHPSRAENVADLIVAFRVLDREFFRRALNGRGAASTGADEGDDEVQVAVIKIRVTGIALRDWCEY